MDNAEGGWVHPDEFEAFFRRLSRSTCFRPLSSPPRHVCVSLFARLAGCRSSLRSSLLPLARLVDFTAHFKRDSLNNDGRRFSPLEDRKTGDEMSQGCNDSFFVPSPACRTKKTALSRLHARFVGVGAGGARSQPPARPPGQEEALGGGPATVAAGNGRGGRRQPRRAIFPFLSSSWHENYLSSPLWLVQSHPSAE